MQTDQIPNIPEHGEGHDDARQQVGADVAEPLLSERGGIEGGGQAECQADSGLRRNKKDPRTGRRS